MIETTSTPCMACDSTGEIVEGTGRMTCMACGGFGRVRWANTRDLYLRRAELAAAMALAVRTWPGRDDPLATESVWDVAAEAAVAYIEESEPRRITFEADAPDGRLRLADLRDLIEQAGYDVTLGVPAEDAIDDDALVVVTTPRGGAKASMTLVEREGEARR